MIAAISSVVSVVAIGFSFFIFFDSRGKDRRDLFLQIHEMLIGDDLQRCRYVLFHKVTDKDSVDQLTDDEWRDIDRALATLSVLGLYVANGYVRECDVMDMWARNICRSWKAAQPFIESRENLQADRPYKYFTLLADRAQQYLRRSGDSTDIIVRQRMHSQGLQSNDN
jgi:hypothetical protein